MTQDPLIGKQLANFRIDRVLGRGGMAQIYYGMDIKLQRPVAIKVIDARYRDNPAYAERFVKEAQAVARWRHENIIQIYYADDQDGLYYYVMELIDGRDLGSIIAEYSEQGDLMPIADVIRIGHAIAKALDFAHQNGVIHRDVKPSNVLVANGGRVVLGDFGLAFDVQQGSLGEVMGSPHYISPEQARRSADVIPQSDIYSLGVILYEMLTGVVPFDDPSPTSVALQHITQPPPLPSGINPEINNETEAVLLRALSKAPNQRYQSGSELMIALEKALTNQEATQKQPAILPLPPVPATVVSPVSASEPVPSTPLKTTVISSRAKTPTQPKKRNGFPLWAWLVLSVLALGVIWWAGGSLGASQLSGMAGSQQPSATETAANDLPLPTLEASDTPTLTETTTPSQTPSPTDTQTLTISLPTATETLTETPTLDETLAASPTDSESAPTDEQTLSPTPDSTGIETPAVTPTPTSAETSLALTPVETSTETPVPLTAAPTPTVLTPTPKYPNGVQIIFFYDENGFYALNNSNTNRSISSMVLERMGLDGLHQERFEGGRWGELYPDLRTKRCMRIEIYKGTNFMNPAECEGQYLSSRIITRDSKEVFWTRKEGSVEFRVLWKREEVGRCVIAAGICEVYIP